MIKDKVIPGPGRVLINRGWFDGIPKIEDIVRLPPGRQQYDRVYPWHDLGAYKSYAQIGDQKRDGTETFSDLTILFANYDPPLKSSISHNSRYYLTILHKRNDSAYINGVMFSDVSLLEVHYPRVFRGEATLIKVVFGFSKMTELKSQPEYRR